MSAMPAAPGLSIETLFGDLNPDQMIADERGERDETPPLSILGKRPSPAGQTDDDSSDNDEENDPPGTEGRGPRDRTNPGTQTNPGRLRAEQVTRRMAKRLRLSDESASLVEQFSQVGISRSLLEYVVDTMVAGICTGCSADPVVRQHHCNQGRAHRVATEHREILVSNQ